MINIDYTQVLELAVDLDRAVTRKRKELRPIVAKGALNIKRDLAAMLGSSSSFGVAAGSVNYDITQEDGYSAEIGPDKSTGAGSLGNIAFFGTSRGGGTAGDPADALRREESNFVEYLGKWAEGLI